MERVLVKTTTDITANLKADRIEHKEDMFFVWNGSELIGAFDIGAIQFIYKTESSKGAEK